ncbi:pseudouridine synthase [Lutibacter sp. TH_r2]|uniref:pseudouridine synthase n=1 Tax=Lutibacter sp. TH_r2 TaxID=3082083 RepID=UPI002952FFF8|nr:pseudouridine synthase [Lutibacter sp. TH_r2]MDV7187642.1 pseudouridine synthase [Lutibacter sp. TH_r2]
MKSNKNSSRGRQAKDSNPRKSTGKKFSSKKNFRDKPEATKKSKQTSKTPSKTQPTEGIRLNKYIANAGICSRREADVFIAAGSATVNGKVVTEMGYKVQEIDEVRFDNSLISPEKKQYVLLNKPKNFITTMDDDRGRRTVMDLIGAATKERIYPVGRLDRNTTGLLLFTNDGELAKKLTHPKHNIQKIYHASLDKKLAMSDLYKISDGFMLDERRVIVDDISYIENQSKTEVGVKIHSGRNRIVRRIFEHFNYTVVKLDRVIFAGLTKKNLPRGHWRHLTEMEVNSLKML